jgi:hypothetical protein
MGKEPAECILQSTSSKIENYGCNVGSPHLQVIIAWEIVGLCRNLAHLKFIGVS